MYHAKIPKPEAGKNSETIPVKISKPEVAIYAKIFKLDRYIIRKNSETGPDSRSESIHYSG
jgi:hypothetical protein